MDETQYSFAAKPRPVQTTRIKYREKKPSNTVFNIMNDPRVVRGSVYAAANAIHLKRDVAPPASVANPTPTAPMKKSIFEPPSTLNTYIPVDLSQFLVEQREDVECFHAETQTDEFLPNDKHKKPFVLKKTGIDASTEILAQDGLFDFDAEVTPLLTVLVNKTLQQARCEVERETEMHHIALYINDLHVKKRVEADGIAKLVERATNAQATKEQVKAEHSRYQQEIDIVRQKVAASKVSHRLLDEAMEATEARLCKRGVYYDPLRRMVETGFMKWMYDKADAAVDAHNLAHLLLMDIVGDSLRKQRILESVARLPLTADGGLVLDARHIEAWGLESIGPLQYSPSLTYAALEDLVAEWITAANATVQRPARGFVAELFS
ncbi:hypothetical protein ACHHYP_01828 [Achlya hypogyna]|uniref:Uncharacterized protein n=1 Tax=Achlya hypogyna TaxID=1202772 RepID=A0A1V9ZSY1_ACHHY|nr:hypothetical protein ACHHYP_01828 [Achlya hypogyna]